MKKGLPKAQKGLAKLARIVKTASKTAGNTTKGAKPVVRKAKRIGDAQKSLSASALSGMTASQLRSKLSSLMKEASAASKAKASTKKLAFKQKGGPVNKRRLMGGLRSKVLNDMDPKVKRAKKELGKRRAGLETTDYAAKFKKSASKVKSKMQKGGPIGKLTPDQKRYLSKVKDTNPLTPPGTAKTKKDLKKATRKGGKTVSSRSGLVTKVNRAGKAKKNQGGGRPMSAKRAIRKMTRKRG